MLEKICKFSIGFLQSCFKNDSLREIVFNSLNASEIDRLKSSMSNWRNGWGDYSKDWRDGWGNYEKS